MAGFEKINTDDLEYGDIVSFEVSSQLKDNIDLLSLVVPVGEITPIMVGITGVPTPDSNIWQECNGSEIVNENSPLRTIGNEQNFTPDLRERYIKVPIIFGQSGQIGGLNNTFIFRHNHAGVTGAHEAPEDGDPSNDQRMAEPFHTHTIQFDFNFSINIEPPFFTVKWFMRIQ